MPGTHGSRIAALPGLGPRDTRDRGDDPPRDLPDFLDAVDAVLDTRETGEPPRMKVVACPTYLLVEFRHIQSRTRCDIGAGIAACMAHGVTELSQHPDIRAYDALREIIDGHNHSTLSLSARTTLYKLIGTSQSPGIAFRLSVPCGDTDVLHFRLPAVYRAKVQTRAAQLGMVVSPIACLTLGLGILEYSDAVDPHAATTLREDLDTLLKLVKHQTERLRELVEMYQSANR